MNPKIIILGLVIVFLFNGTGCSAKESSSYGQKPVKIYEESNLPQRDSVSNSLYLSRRNAITRAVEMASPAVVGINVMQYVKVPVWDPFDDPIFEYFFGKRQRRYRMYPVKGLGSGFLISPDGYILTNYHVSGDASEIIVTTTDGKKHKAKVVGSDELSDIALLKIEGENFPYLKLGNSDDVIVGEWVIALGNPFGLFDLNSKPTVTVGVVSNKGVNLMLDNKYYKGMIQTDAAISSGNSGGPLINSLGEVIGINTMIYSTATSSSGAGSIGIGWAIPINRVKKIINRFVTNKLNRANINRLGLGVVEPNSEEAQLYRLNFEQGLFVVEIKRNSLADKAGFQVGDVIIEINGEKVNSIEEFKSILLDTFEGDVLNFKVSRNDRIINLKIEF